MVSALVAVSQARHAALKAAGTQPPNPVPIQGLVDTGASTTCVDPSVLTALGIQPTGMSNVCTAGASKMPMAQYDIGLIIVARPSQSPLIEPNLPVFGASLLQAQGFHALIGRDVLSKCLMTYDGLSGFFSVAY